MKLRSRSSAAWLDAVLSDFDAFLVDHAACERKASAAALSFVVRYRDRPDLVDAMIELAREELEHFQRVWKLLAERGLGLARDEKDPYVGRMGREVRHGTPWTRMDRLLVAGVIEARGCERFRMIGEAQPEGPLRALYLDLARAEARHQNLFAELAGRDYEPAALSQRMAQLLEIEAEVVASLELRPALQ